MELEQILPLVVGFVILSLGVLLIIRKVLGSHADLAARRLQKLNEENLRREVELKKKLDEAEAAYKKKLAEAEKEAQVLKEKIQKEALALKDKILHKAEQEKNEIITEAREEAESLKATAAGEMEQKVINTAGDILRRVFTAELTAEFNNYFTGLIIEQLDQSSGQKIETPAATAEITGVSPLLPEQKKKLTDILSARTGKKITIVEKPDENRNLAGIYIKLGDVVIDGTLNNRLKHILSQLR